MKSKAYLLLTAHRPHNVDNLSNLKKIIDASIKSKEKIVFPIHPRTKKQICKLKYENAKNIRLIDPVGYTDMIMLIKNAKKVLTDSGGIQKEAFWLKTPCITLRNKTEWIETVKNGWNILTGTNKEKIADAIRNFQPKKRQEQHYGNGKSAEKIIKILLKNSNQGY